MQVRLKFVPVRVLAPDNQLLVLALIVSLLQTLSHIFEVVQNFVIDAALGMPGIVSREAIAASATRQWAKNSVVLV